MNAVSLWIIYIITLLVTFFLLYFILSPSCVDSCGNFNSLVFITSLIGAIIIFMCLLWLDPITMDVSEKLLISILILVAFLLPVIIIIYLVWQGYLFCDKMVNKECMFN